jgi:hypothetical protein
MSPSDWKRWAAKSPTAALTALFALTAQLLTAGASSHHVGCVIQRASNYLPNVRAKHWGKTGGTLASME